MLLRFFHKGGVSIFGPLEADVMDAVWDESNPLTVGDVHRVLSRRGRRIAYSTVKAVLNNLSDKGYLKKAQQGRGNIFRATQSRDAFKQRLVRDVLSSLMKEHRTPLLAHLVNELATDRKSAEELEALIRQRRSELSKRP